MPSSPRSPPRALASSVPPGSAPHAQGGAPGCRAPRLQPPPQPLPGARLRSHLPSPAQTSGGWPGPFPQLGAWGSALSNGGVGAGRRLRVPGGGWPGRTPRRPLSWQHACSRPEGANRRCENSLPVQHRRSLKAGCTGYPATEGKVGRSRAGLNPTRRPLISTRSFCQWEG